jgi:hypothetical protein
MKTKLKSTLTTYVFIFFIPLLLNIESVINLYKIIFKDSNMNGIQIYQLIALPVFFVGVYYYYNHRFDKQKEDIIKYAKKLSDADNKIIEAYNRIYSQKMKYLYECINSNQILPEPEKWIDDYSIGLLQEWAKETDRDIAKIEKKLNIKLSDYELNRDIKQIPE